VFCEVLDRIRNVVCRIERHHFARGHNAYFVGVSLANGKRKASAHHVAKDVVKHDVGLIDLKGMERFELLKSGNNASDSVMMYVCYADFAVM
jgi:hypothetical protein